MKKHCLMVATFVVGLGLALLLQPGLLSPWLEGLQPLYAQGSEETKFWTFDGHMHPTWSVYYRGGTLAEPSDPRLHFPRP